MMNAMQIVSEFNKFKQSYKGNAKQEVEKLVAEGKISQAQLNQLQQMATELQKMMR